MEARSEMDFPTPKSQLCQTEAEGRGLEIIETEGLENPFPIKPTFINVIL